jgi:hypothetical protein
MAFPCTIRPEAQGTRTRAPESSPVLALHKAGPLLDPARRRRSGKQGNLTRAEKSWFICAGRAISLCSVAAVGIFGFAEGLIPDSGALLSQT